MSHSTASPPAPLDEGALGLLMSAGNGTNASVADTASMELARKSLAYIFAALTVLSAFGNLALLGHIVYRRLYRNFVSTHFIGHLMLTNLITCAYPIPFFIYGLHKGKGVFDSTVDEEIKARTHGFFFTALWVVTYYMVACIAGVHMITFKRIHYDQLFGLSPHVICALAWVVGLALGLPSLTNQESVQFHLYYYHYLWKPRQQFTYNYLTYLLLLGTFLPIFLTFYAYIRVLAIFYHAPVVFEAMGLFRSRYLIFTLLLMVLCQAPFFVAFLENGNNAGWVLYPVLMFFAYAISLMSPFLYGLSLYLLKEDDIALTHRARRQSFTQHVPPAPTLHRNPTAPTHL